MKLIILSVAVIGAATLAAQTQTPRVVKLDIQLDNSVCYRMDTPDPTKLAVDPNPTTALTKTFMQTCQIDDVVSVNGKPASGLHVTCSWRFSFNPNPAPGQAVADAAISNSWPNCNWELLSKDGKFVGRLVDGGFFPHSILGGAGLFLGASGEHHFTSQPGRPDCRVASATEDPSRRRLHPGSGAYRVQYYLTLPNYPGFDVTPEGPAIFHSDDYSLVTPAKPARAGELLIARAKYLGPTTPYFAPGQRFPEFAGSTANAEVNADVEITVDGQPADVVYKIGWPGEVGSYRVDFRLPALTPGMAKVQLTAAWIPGDEVTIPVQ